MVAGRVRSDEKGHIMKRIVGRVVVGFYGVVLVADTPPQTVSGEVVSEMQRVSARTHHAQKISDILQESDWTGSK